MAADKGISDNELRRQLQSFGEDVPPVTPQTRPLLLRKLKKLNKGSPTTKPTPKTPPKATKKSVSTDSKRRSTPSRRLIGFSSDEEETESGLMSSKRSKRSPGRASKTEPDTNSLNYRGRRNQSDSVGLSRDSTRRTSGMGRSAESFTSNDDSLPNSYGNTSQERFSSESKVYRRPAKFEVDETDSGRARKYEIPQVDSQVYGREGRQVGASANVQESKERVSDAVNIFLAVFAVVCIVIMFVYAMQSPTVARSGVTTQASLPLCKGNALTVEKKPKDCVKLEDAANLYADYLFDVLSHRKGAVECQDELVTNSSISVGELKTKIKKDRESRSASEQQEIFKATLKQIRNNSHWGIKIYGPTGEELIESEVAIKSLSCRVKEALSRVVVRAILVVVAFCFLLAMYYFVRNRWRREEEETRLMYHFVEKILDILHNHHNDCKKDKDLTPYLPIPHVRDMVIAPQDRQKLSKVWHKAVRFLSANESRVRVESQRIAGEDFEVWRWIQTVAPRQQHHKRSLLASLKSRQGRVWQGQAFENFQSAVNPPIISPTPCLKIRNMFDPDVEADESWHVIIQDAILEKCAENNASIVHIAVEKSSSEGCVYIKCATHASAGLAFRSLHGCWFDGRLVAVKYLTLKRYHQRFPMALEATVPLKPSGSFPSSLVTFNPETEEDEEPEINDSDFEA